MQKGREAKNICNKNYKQRHVDIIDTDKYIYRKNTNKYI